MRGEEKAGFILWWVGGCAEREDFEIVLGVMWGGLKYLY